MSVTLSYPNYPFSVTFTLARFEELLFSPISDDLINWLLGRQGGPMLVTSLSNDPSQPFEKLEIVLPDTSHVESWEMEDMLNRPNHVGRGTVEAPLTIGFVRFSFANEDSAVICKLTFGGA